MKYPRTYHLPWSPGISSDDKIMETTDVFQGQLVVVTEKMDGENCTMTKEGIHARSVSSTGGKLRERVKKVWAEKGFLIPDGYRICGENLQWEHSIRYENLVYPFYIFSIWAANNRCLAWGDTVGLADELGIPLVRELYVGIYDEEKIKSIDIGDMEGYVVRLHEGFHHDVFYKSVGKYVRKNHVQTDEHWTRNLKENGFL